MKINRKTVIDIKEEVSLLKGKKVEMLVNKGRKQLVKFQAEVVATYPCVFSVEPINDTPSKISPSKLLSYAYSEILCGNVKIICKDKQINNLTA